MTVGKNLGRWSVSVGGSYFENDLWAAGLQVSWRPPTANLRNIAVSGTENPFSYTSNLEASGGFGRNTFWGIDVDHSNPKPENIRRSANTTQALASVSHRGDFAELNYDYRDVIGETAFHRARVSGGVVMAGWLPKLVRPIYENSGYLEIDTDINGVQIDHPAPATSRFNERAAIEVQAFTPQAISINRSSLPDGYSAGPSPNNIQVMPGARAKVKIDISAPGFLLHIKDLPAGAAIQWNGREQIHYSIGAYIENAQVGANVLTIDGKDYKVDVPILGIDAPDYYFDRDQPRKLRARAWP